MENCAIYSHYISIEKVIPILNQFFPSGKIEITGSETQWSQITVVTDKSFWKKGNTLRLSCRQRQSPGYELFQSSDPLMENLTGMYHFFSSFPASNSDLHKKLLYKITTLNTEIGVSAEPGFITLFYQCILKITEVLDGVIFSNPTSVFPDLGMYNSSGVLLLNRQGESHTDALIVSIESTYYDAFSATEPDERKNRNNLFLQSKGIAVNGNLPRIANEQEVSIRSAYEIAERVTILATINLVAFNSILPEDAIQYFKDYKLWDRVTNNEKDLLENTTQEKKDQATWQCEGIWILLWALNKADSIPFPDHLCSLNDLTFYPFQGFEKDPKQVIESLTTRRSDSEILDQADLYYRIDWACVNARVKGQEINLVHLGVVYERHYALNWLIQHRNQEWDEVTCDT